MLPICHLDDLADGESKGLQDGAEALIAVRQRNQLHVYINRCPHRSIPLEWQPDRFLDYDKRFIQCATHGALFEIDSGLCIQGPCVDDHLEKVDIEIDAEGFVFIRRQ